MVQGIPASSPYPLQPAAPQVPAPPAVPGAATPPSAEAAVVDVPAPIQIEIEIPPAAGPGQRAEAGMEAKGINFEQISKQIIEEVTRVQRLDRPAQIILRIGDQSLVIDPGMLSKEYLKQVLEEHFQHPQGLGDPAHLQSVAQLQASSQSILVQIRQPAEPGQVPAQVPAPAEPAAPLSPQLQTLARELEKQVPARIREAYGLTPDALKAWAAGGAQPEGVGRLLQDFGPGHQDLYAAILHAVAFGKAAIEARAKAGTLAPDQAKTASTALDALKAEAGRKWEKLNASAVGDSRRVAAQALSSYRQAEADLQAVQGRLKEQAQPSEADQKALAAAQQRAAKAGEASAKAQRVALDTAYSMKDVRVRQAEIQGAGAPEAVRVRASQAVLDAAGAQASEAQLRQLSGSADPADALASSQALVEQAAQLTPEWQQHQALVSQREGVLESQRAVIKPALDAVAQDKQRADQLAAARTRLHGLPPAGQGLAAQEALRKQLEREIKALDTPAPGPADPLGSPTRPAEMRLIHLYAVNTGALQQTYAADIALNNVPSPSPVQRRHLQDVSRKDRDLGLEVAAAAHDGIEADQGSARHRQETQQWQSFGRADAQHEIDAANAEIQGLAKAKTPDELKRLSEAQCRLAAGMQSLRDGDARAAAGNITPSGNFAGLQARELAEVLGHGRDNLAQLASGSEELAGARHITLGTTYHGPQGVDAAWYGENAQFLRARSGLATRRYEQNMTSAEMAASADQAALRQASTQRARLAEIGKELAALPADDPARKALESERGQLRSALTAFGQTPVGSLGAEATDAQRRQQLSEGPLARMRAIGADQEANLAALRQQLEQTPAPRSTAEKQAYKHLQQQALVTTLAAAETFSNYSPGTAADRLRAASQLADSLGSPEERQRAQLEIKQRGLEIYKAYVRHPHSSVDPGAAALARAVESAVYPHGKGAGLLDVVKTEWEALRAQSDPRKLFAQHRSELEAALEILQARVTGDIDASFNLAVERGGMAIGTVARVARSMARDGDIAGARALLAKAVGEEIRKAEQAQQAYSALAPDQQEHYRAVLRSHAPEQAKREALEGIFGYRVGADAASNAGAEHWAAQALSVSGASQTMVRANAPGSDYDLSRSADTSAAALADPSSGLRPRGGAEAEAIAARYASHRQRDETYWNNPTIAIMTSLVDEAALFALTLGVSTAFSLAKGAVTGINAARNTLTLVQRSRQLMEASRAGRAILSAGAKGAHAAEFVGTKVAGANRSFTRALASVDGWLMRGGSLSRGAGWAWRGGRSMARNVAMEQSLKGAAYLAEQVSGKDSWLSWAVNTGGRMASMNLGEIKGLEMLENSAWNVIETVATEAALPAYYANDPKGLESARDALHYLLMGVQTVHGMAKMHADAGFSARLETEGLAHDLGKSGVELGKGPREALLHEVTRYQESLLHNQGSVSPKDHEAFAARIGEISGLQHLSPEVRSRVEPQVKAVVDNYLAPYRIQVAATHSGFDKLRLDKAEPQAVHRATEAMAAELVKQGVASDPAQGLQIARGQLAGQLVAQAQFGAFDYSKSSEELHASLSKEMDATARRLLETGIAETPAHAMLLVSAEIRQHMGDAAARLAKSPNPEASAALERNFAHTERYAAAFSQAMSLVPAQLPTQHVARLQQTVLDTLMADARPKEAGKDLPLAQELQGRIYAMLGESKAASPGDAGFQARDLARQAMAGWSEQLLARLEPLPGLAGFERHNSLLRDLGVGREDAAQIAHDRYFEQTRQELSRGLEPKHQALVSELMHD
ncbi:MAG TPA: hypothetical protein V6D23_12800, partial [Candidatus Obscuribacterales bacterium]